MGVPVDGDFRISADVEVNIYKYYRGLFCGYGKRTVTQVERWECNAFLVCQWEDRTNMLPGALVTVEGRIYGTIKVSGSNYQMCGFGDVGTPGDPDVPPDRSEIGCDDGPLVTGHLNSNLGDPSSEIFDFDVDEASVTINSNVYTFDFPPVDLPSDSLSGTESTWCGSWLPD